MWCFNTFIEIPEIERTERINFILQFNLQPSTFLIIESPRIRACFTKLFFSFGFYFFLYLCYFLLLKSSESALWCSFSVEILGLLIFSLFVDDILDSLFGFSFCKNTDAISWFFSVRDFIKSMFIFSFLR